MRRATAPSPRGIPIGNLTSQLFANVYLHEVDVFAKHHLKVRRYVRYMDDILFFHEDKAQLHGWRREITAFLERELQLTVNPRKVRVYPAASGVGFVGFTIYRTHMSLRGQSVRRFQKRYRRQLKRMAANTATPSDVRSSVQSWQAHAAHTSSDALMERVRRSFEQHAFAWSVREAYRRAVSAKPGDQLRLFDDEM